MYKRPLSGYIVAEDPASYKTPSVEPVHFWDSSREDIVALRKSLLINWFLASLELWILIFVISAIYIGTGADPNRYAINIDVTIIDFDGDLAGYYLRSTFEQTPPGNTTLHWRYRKGSDYGNDVNNPRREVENGKVWACVVLRPNTTRFINESFYALINTTTSLISPFNTTPPILVAYEEGRASYTLNNYVLPPIRTVVATATARYARALRQILINQLSSVSNSSNNRNSQLLNTFRLGSLLVDPLTARYYNIHPAYRYVGQSATTLAYIYIYLVSSIVVGATMKFVGPFVGKIKLFDLLTFRIVNSIFQSFIITLIFSLIVLWFFNITSGSLFMRYWMFNWLAALVFEIIFVVFTTNFGLIGNSVLLAFLVLMLGGATIQISLELSPAFYNYGYGLPVYNIMNGGRHLLFGSHSRFALNVGILLLYLFVFMFIGVCTTIFWLKRQEKKILAEKEKKKTSSKESPGKKTTLRKIPPMKSAPKIRQ